MLVDHTSPELIYVRTLNNTLYQYSDDRLDFKWDFQDHESGIAEYRCAIFETIRGRRNKFWPTLNSFHTIPVNMTSDTREEELHLDGIILQNGALYALQVTAVNRAKMATSEESKGVMVDTTPPVVLRVNPSYYFEKINTLKHYLYFNVNLSNVVLKLLTCRRKNKI